MKKISALTGTISVILLMFNNGGAQNNYHPGNLFENFKQDFLLQEKRVEKGAFLPVQDLRLKSAATYHKLDSIVHWISDHDGTLHYDTKETFFYNEDSICELRLDYAWDDAAKVWVNSKKWTETSNETRDTSQFSEFRWDAGAEDWIPYSKYITIIEGENEEFNFYVYISAFQQWMHFARGLRLVIPEGNGYVRETSLWMADNTTMELVKFMNSVEVYDSDNQLISTILYSGEKDREDWIPEEKYIYTGNSQSGLRERTTKQLWDEEINGWRNEAMTEYFYDERQNTSAEINYSWHAESGSWHVIAKEENKYDDEDNYLGTTYYNRDTINDAWINATRLEILTEDYFEHYHLVYSSWDTLSGEWQYTTRTYNEMNIPAGQEYLIMPERWYKASYLSAVANQSFYDWDVGMDDWKMTAKSEVFYSGFNNTNTAAVKDYPGKIRIYPNPVQTILYLNGHFDMPNSEIMLYNINGQKVMHAKAINQLDVSHLPNGIYLFQVVENNKAILNGKLIKK